MALTIPTHIGFKLPHLFQQQNRSLNLELIAVDIKKPPKNAHFYCRRHPNFLPKLRSTFRFGCVARVCSDGGSIPQQASTSEWGDTTSSSSNSADSYIGLFVRMLGLDNDPLDREEAIIALWKYSLGGKQYIDSIMQFRGCLNLTVNLLKAENSSSTCEAAAGLLRMISLVNSYRETVAESGAIEEITGLLTRSSSPSNVKEQSICTLWNLSVDEKIREKIANPDIVILLIRFLDDEDIKVKEAAGGVLANLALSRSNHSLMIEAGVISKLAVFLKTDVEGSTVIRKEAKNTLLELCKDDYYRILIIEEGLLLVPLVGASAYKSYKPTLYSWPSLPDGMDVKKTWKAPSRYGASELLLGMNIEDKDMALEEIKMNSIVGRTRQQFLARVGAIETEDKESLSIGCSQTLLPWTDGVARLVLILGLEDERAVASAGRAIADASVNEYLRVSFKEAGAVKYLATMLEHPNDAIRSSAVLALERLSISNSVCQTIGDQDYLPPLISSLMQLDISENLLDKVLDILGRVLDPRKKMKSKFYDLPVNGDADENDIPSSSPTFRTGIEQLDSTFLERLVDIMKSSSSSSNLQRKAVSILESVSVTDEPSMDKFLPLLDIQSGLLAVFHQNFKTDTEQDLYYEQPEKHALETEESGMAISAASRLLTKLLDYEQFRSSLNPSEFIDPLRRILKSNVIPVQNKDWIAACLVKLISISLGPYGSLTNPINTEVTVHERIPRLIGDLKNKSSLEEREEAVVELNRIVSEGVTEAGRAVAASEGGIYALRRLIEEGRPAAVEAALAILYNLSMEGENREAVVAGGVGPALRRIVMAERPYWFKALHLLRILS